MNIPAGITGQPTREAEQNRGPTIGAHARRTLWLFAILAAAIWTARWVWIVRNNGDFGITYEAAARVAKGEIWGRDFFVTVPPLTYYTEAILYRALHGNVACDNIHLFFWWILSLVVGVRLTAALGASTETLVAGALLAMAMSMPAGNYGLAYNYTEAVWIGLAALLVIRIIRTHKWAFPSLLIGVLLGLAIITKQNSGALMAAFFGVALVYIEIRRLRFEIRRVFLSALLYIAGVGLGAGLPLCWLAQYSSLSNLLQIMFKDGVAGKGGLSVILVRVIPRFLFTDLARNPFRRVPEFGLAVLTLGFLVFFTYRAYRKHAANKPSPIDSAPGYYRSLVIFLGALAGLSILSLFNIPVVRWLGARVAASVGTKTIGFEHFNGVVCYVVLFGVVGTLLVFHLLSRGSAAEMPDKNGPQPARCIEEFIFAFGLACAVAAATSDVLYFTFAAPLAVPPLVYALGQYLKIPLSKVNYGSAVCAALVYLWPGMGDSILGEEPLTDDTPLREVIGNGETFCTYRPLPVDSLYAGLWADPVRWREVRRFLTEVRPLILGKRTLWLAECDAHSAVGGIPVPSVTGMNIDTYGPRIEPQLMQEWEAHPPERIVTGRYVAPPGSVWLSESGRAGWISKRYDLIYDRARFQVWALKK